MEIFVSLNVALVAVWPVLDGVEWKLLCFVILEAAHHFFRVCHPSHISLWAISNGRQQLTSGFSGVKIGGEGWTL
jgi:hypothetical protein